MLTLLTMFLRGLGLAAGCTAFITYISRYSSFDARYGEIDQDLYLQITKVAPAEWAAVQIGAALILVASVLFVVRLTVTGRARAEGR